MPVSESTRQPSTSKTQFSHVGAVRRRRRRTPRARTMFPLLVYSIRDEAPLGPAARILVHRRRASRSAGRRGMSLRGHPDLRRAGRPGPPARARAAGAAASAPATSSPMRCPTASTCCAGSWRPTRAGSSPSPSTRRSRGPRSSASSTTPGRAAVVLHADFADRVDQLSGTGSITLRVSVGGDDPGLRRATRRSSRASPTTEPPDRRLGIPIAYSSGTTGQPKAVVRPAHRGIDPSVAADRHEELRPCLPVPALHRRAPGVGRHAPRRLPGLLPRRAERRPGSRHPGQVRPREDAGRRSSGTGSPPPTWCRPSSSACSACPRR